MSANSNASANAHSGANAHKTATVARDVERALRPLIRGELPVRLEAWDGSAAGPQDAPVVQLNSPNALRRQLWAPGELGAAQAYVAGDIDVPGDLLEGMNHVWDVIRARDLAGAKPGPTTLARIGLAAARIGVLGPPPPRPDTQAVVRGRLHSLRRDRAVISHHYDLPTEFYAQILDESMAYSCGWFPGGRPDPSREPGAILAEAQRAKFELVCGDLGLRPGDRLLDIGCGWGSMAIHAAATYGVQVTAVTISREQQMFARARAASLGVGGLIDFRLQDYRELAKETAGFDAVVSLEMGEHVGDANYPVYARTLASVVRPGGRVLVQQMSRGGRHRGGGPFIEAFIAPDMSMRPPGETLDLLVAGGLELLSLRPMREHYAWTAEQWRRRFLAARPQIAERWGDETARVWDLYLTGGSRSFAEGRMGVEQFVLRRPEGTFAL